MNQLKIEYIALEDLKPYKNNARKHEEADLKTIENSIKEFGMCDPIGIWGDNVIVEGHGRMLALKKLGHEAAPCIRLDHLTDEQRRAYGLAHNKTAEMSEWDFDMLDIELEDILDIDMEAFGFEFDVEEPEEAIEDDYDGELPEEPKSKLGDVYQLGRHRLMCGDSTNLTDVQKLMGDDLADLLLTDPPYNVDYEGKTKDKLKIENDKMDNDNFRQFLVDAFSNADMVMKHGAVFYIWHADSEGYNFRGACFDVGWKVRQCIIWNKNTMVMGRQDYQWKHEPCLYGWKDGAGHLWASDRKQTTVINFDKPSRNALHPTMKPIPLFDYQIKNNTKGDDIVLDLFGGSGTTMMACEQNGRRAYTMEFDPRYVDVIIERWEQFTGQKAVLVE
jgi:site-specific DNA-methyltransferase (adenine-specific)